MNISEDIIKLLRNRDEKGLSLLYDHYAPSLMGIIVRIVRNNYIAEEVLQQSMLKAWNNISAYNDNRGTLFTWLATIARNAAIDQIRLKSHQNHGRNESLDANVQLGFVSSPTDAMDTNRLLQNLDEKYKSVIDLIYLQGHTQNSAAQLLEIPLGTVKTRVKHGIDLLRKELSNELGLFGMMLLLTLLMMLLWA